MTSPSCVRLLAAAIVALALSGCGGEDEGELAIATGKLLENGKPFVFDKSKLQLPQGATGPPPGSEGLRILFTPVEGEVMKKIEGKEGYLAVFNTETSTFEVKGSKGKGIRTGKYKVAITASFSISGKDKDEGDYFGGKFTREKTPIIREVKPGEEIIIDVAKPQG